MLELDIVLGPCFYNLYTLHVNNLYTRLFYQLFLLFSDYKINI